VSYYVLLLKDPASAPAWSKAFNGKAKTAGLALSAAPWQKHAEGDLYRRTLSVLDTYADFMSVIMLVMVGLVVIAAAMKLVGERTREIGMLRALGFRSRSILVALGYEAVVIALLGVVMGAIATFAVAVFINAMNFEYFVGGMTQPAYFRLAYTPRLYVIAAAYLGSICVVTILKAVHGKLRAPICANLSET
jgi:ABC-type lipoprotein release transport system permease subunit